MLHHFRWDGNVREVNEPEMKNETKGNQMKRISHVITLAAALGVAGLIAVPSAQAQGVCVDSVTAGGWIPDGGPDLFANFGLNAREEIQGGVTTLTGQLNFVDADEDCHVVGFEVLSYSEEGEADAECATDDGQCRTIVYAVTVMLGDVPQVGTFEATVVVCDNGEGGNAVPDFFSIEVVDVTDPLNPVVIETCSASGCLAGGDVQVHEIGGPDCP